MIFLLKAHFYPTHLTPDLAFPYPMSRGKRVGLLFFLPAKTILPTLEKLSLLHLFYLW